ncbi:hypothetical protein BZA05DRAFT_381125 [Tricharina praecox]|uniref:uncharacterized protein n=1 Tax=Tricharina praecox TaxID=43433 RepID=UPI00221F7308|nr:uncharacterized protein BZA05DRAFT_381125 [Tricharina praecox]KAI5858410.1 hypothetical protein BZA05DRAFT_381125 [Tricharina praecox]
MRLSAHQSSSRKETRNHDEARSHPKFLRPAMADIIPAGSYVIRLIGSGKVLWSAGTTGTGVKVGVRNEGNPQYREDQTWYIEPIPEQHEFFDENTPTLYTITRLASGSSLDAPDLKRDGRLWTYKSHGAPWQLWRLVEVADCDDRMHYNIINEFSGLALDRSIEKDKTERITMWDNKNNANQKWELVIPVSSVPIGWHQLRNVGTGHILSHSYPSSLPILISPTEPKHTSNYYETWRTQWAIIHGHGFNGGAAVGSFQIRNRFTGGFLRPRGSKSPAISKTMEETVNGWQTSYYRGEKLWTLELDGRRNWKIVEEATGNLLGEAVLRRSFGGGNTLECCSKRPNPHTSWELIPMQEVDAAVTMPGTGSPPVYPSKNVNPTFAP